MSVILEEGLPERSRTLGKQFRQQLRQLAQNHSSVKEVRGMGLMIGVEMDFAVGDLLKTLRGRGILPVSRVRMFCVFSPLIIEESVLSDVVKVLDDLLYQCS